MGQDNGWLADIIENHTERIGTIEKTQGDHAVKMERLEGRMNSRIDRLESKFTIKYVLIVCALIMLASALGSGIAAQVIKLLPIAP